jgi:hypothetical protein
MTKHEFVDRHNYASEKCGHDLGDVINWLNYLHELLTNDQSVVKTDMEQFKTDNPNESSNTYETMTYINYVLETNIKELSKVLVNLKSAKTELLMVASIINDMKR